MANIKSPTHRIIDGVAFRSTTSDLLALLWLFLNAPKLDIDPMWRQEGMLPADLPYCGSGRHRYSRLITELQRPLFEWNPWAIQDDMAYCNSAYPRTAICGGGGSSKSYTAGDFAFKFWECAPDDTAVVIASTTVDAARKRIWKSISTAYLEVTRRMGRLGESQMISSPKPAIRSKRGDDVHGIWVVPVKQGSVEQAVDAIKGYHARRMLIVRDESDSVSEAIVQVESNLRIGAEEFRTIDLGNLPSSLNPLGKQMEAFPGKPITEALGLEWISHMGVKCIRHDGEFSPNIKDNGKWTGLMTEADRADIERTAKGRNTRTYFVMVKGLPPPTGVDDTVCSEPLLHAHHVFDKVIWKSSVKASASLDPGLGGDPCLFRTYKEGLDSTGVFRVLLDEVIVIPVPVGDPHNPAEYAIAEKVKSLCQSRGILPDDFIAGTTGIGSGVKATLQREWSPAIHFCEEGGAPSSLPISDEDPRPANEVYDRRVSELWFSIREYIEADIIRGMDDATAVQLCQRKWDYQAKKKSIQKKSELPTSPNEADSFAFKIELLRRKGINASVQTPAKAQVNDKLEREARAQDFDAQETYQSDYAYSESDAGGWD